MRSLNDFHFFINGPFSNWHQCLFTVDGMEFTSGEQWMMYSKAKLFEDKEMMQKIMLTANCRTIKEYGRQVKNYDENRWGQHRFNLVKKGLREKFKQNPTLKDYLSLHASKTIVEAAAYDRIWGIGYGMDDPNLVQNYHRWGQNLLGRCLNDLAKEFKLN